MLLAGMRGNGEQEKKARTSPLSALIAAQVKAKETSQIAHEKRLQAGRNEDFIAEVGESGRLLLEIFGGSVLAAQSASGGASPQNKKTSYYEAFGDACDLWHKERAQSGTDFDGPAKVFQEGHGGTWRPFTDVSVGATKRVSAQTSLFSDADQRNFENPHGKKQRARYKIGSAKGPPDAYLQNKDFLHAPKKV